MHNNREGSSRPRDPPGRGEGLRRTPLSGRGIFRASVQPPKNGRTVENSSAAFSGRPRRRIPPVPPARHLSHLVVGPERRVRGQWVRHGVRASSGVPVRWEEVGPRVSFYVLFFAPRDGARPPAASVGRKATRFLQGVLREGPGSPRLKTWRRAGLAAKAGHCERMYTKRVMTHGDGKTG